MSGAGKDGRDGSADNTQPEVEDRPDGTRIAPGHRAVTEAVTEAVDEAFANTLTRSDPEAHSFDQVGPGEADRYQVRGELGRGGQSVVKRAWDVRLEREVAIKELRGDSTEATRDRFWREARITARLEHPNIVPVYEIGRRVDGTLYCVQRLVRSDERDGQTRTLRAALTAARTLDERLRLLPQFLAVCQGIAYAHAQGILHRDIKPENVVLGQFGETVILDWGLARVVGDHARPSEPVEGAGATTLAGVAYGTPAYMSPEQARGETVTIDARSDVWSLGVLLFELLAGRQPFTGPSVVEVIEQVRDAPVPDARNFESLAPPELAAVARRAMERDPAARYPTAQALAEEIIAWQSGRRVSVYRYSLLESSKLFFLRHKAAASSGLAVLLAILVSGVVVWTRLVAARRANSHALVEKARAADRQLKWNHAALYYAAARVYDDNPETQWGVRTRSQRTVARPIPLADRVHGVKALAYSPDGARLAAAHVGGKVTISSARDGAPLEEWDAHVGDALCLDWSADGRQLATGGKDGRVVLWDAARRDTPRELSPASKDPVNRVALSQDGRWAGLGFESGKVELVALPTGPRHAFIAEPEKKPPPVYGLALDPLRERLAVATWSGMLQIRTFSGELIQSLPRLASRLLDVRYSPNGKSLAVAGNDKMVRWYDLDAEGKVLVESARLLEGHQSKVYALAFSSDSRVLASVGTDQTMRLWRAEGRRTQPMVGRSLGGLGELEAVAFSPDGRQVAVGGQTAPGGIYAVPEDDAVMADPDERLEGLQTAPGLDWYAFTTGSGPWLIRLGERAALPRDLETRGTTREVAISRDGRLVAWPCPGHEVCYGAAPGLPSFKSIAFPFTDASRAVNGAVVRSIGLARDGSWLAASDRSGDLRMWSLPDGAVKAPLAGHQEAVFSLDASPDGALLASGSYDHTVRLWNTDRGTLAGTLEGHTQGVRRVRFSPDGKLLASTGWDRSVKVWDVANRTIHCTGAGHEDHVYGLDWAPDGSWLATGARDGTVRVWDPKTCRALATVVTDESEVYALAVWGNGKGLSYAGAAVHSFQFQPLLSPGDQLREVERRTGLRLDEEHLVAEQLR